MALHFIYGNAGSGKSGWLYQKMLDLAQENKSQQIFLVVPEQFTLQAQKELVRRSAHHVIMNIDVVSFERLAFRVADELGQSDTVLEETGKSLILRKIAGEREKDLTILRANIRRMGTIDHIKSMISELMQYEAGPEDIREWIGRLPAHSALSYKLSDILVIYEDFLEYIRGSYITAEQILDVLAKRAPESEMLQDAVICFDGFTGFTPAQMHLMHALMKKASEMYVTVTFEKNGDFYCRNHIEDLFYMSRKMVQSLTEIAGEESFAIGSPVVLSGENGRFSSNPELSHLEKNLFRIGGKPYLSARVENRQMKGGGEEQVMSAGSETQHASQAPVTAQKTEPISPVPGTAPGTEHISLASCMTPKQELEYAAASIAMEVREKGMRYRDFAIVSADAGTYEKYAENVFRKYGIPFFSDSRRDILYHPLTECIRGALEAISEDYRQDCVFRFLRTGLTDLDRNEVDRLENYCIAKGIRGHRRWNTNFRMPAVKNSSEADREAAADQMNDLNRMRAYTAGLLEPLYQLFHGKTPSVREITEVLYMLLGSLNAEQKTQEEKQKMEEAGRMEEASVNEQIWRLVMDLLDKFVLLLGSEEMKADAYAEILDAGFSAVRVGIIPPGEDVVLLGDIERSRMDGVKQVYFLGLNDGIVPKRTDPGNILSEYDRQCLKEMLIELAPTAREEIFIQRFYLYWSLTKPSESLHLTYHLTGADGRAARPSYLVGMLENMFPGLLCIQVDEEHPIPPVTPESGLECLIRGFREKKNLEWNALYHWYQSQDSWRQTVRELTDAAFFRAEKPVLKTETALNLYGSRLVNSVTRLENFARCAFSHFLRYGLHLQERDTHSFEAVDLGVICHEILARFSGKAGTGKDWLELTPEKSAAILSSCMEEMELGTQESVLFDSARNHYMFDVIRRLMQTSLDVAIRQIRAGEFFPEKYEAEFLQKVPLGGQGNSLPAGSSLALVGKIDRLDVLRNGENVPQSVRIIDYKSGSRDFSLQEFYYGLQMQLVLYLQAAAGQAGLKGLQPGGVFYFHLDDPLVEEAGEAGKIREAVMSRMRLKGLVNASPDLYTRMDHGIAETGNSLVVPLKLNKDGSISARGSKTATSRQFETLSTWGMEKIRESGEQILEGVIDIAPYQMGTQSGCDYCPYNSVCEFDSRMDGFTYRKLENLSDGDIWLKMEEREKQKSR